LSKINKMIHRKVKKEIVLLKSQLTSEIVSSCINQIAGANFWVRLKIAWWIFFKRPMRVLSILLLGNIKYASTKHFIKDEPRNFSPEDFLNG